MKTKSAAQPKVSVIIPCYNSGQFLDETIDSVLKQTYTNFEIIVVDDGSTDEATKRLLANYRRSKTRVFHLPKNQGPSVARNVGIKAATGKYILPLDADDKIAPQYMKKAIEVLEKNAKIGIVYCRAKFFGNREGEWILPKYSFPEILLDNMIFATAFFRKKSWVAVKGFNANMVHGMEDYDFWLSLIEKEKCQVHCINEILFYYRIRSDSRTTNLAKEDYEITMFTQIFYNHKSLYLRDNNMRKLYENRMVLLKEINRLRRIIDASPTLKVEKQLNSYPWLKRVYGKFFNILYQVYLVFRKLKG